MKRFFTIMVVIILFISTSLSAQNKLGKSDYIIGFYNLENLFDTYNDPVKNDEQFLPEGSNNWTDVKYQKKLSNMAKVIKSMAVDNGRYHTILGVCEIENRLVLEDLVMDPQIADANFGIVHYDGPDRRGVDVALLYRQDQFEVLGSESIRYTFEGSSIDFIMTQKERDYFRTRDILMVHGLIDGEHFAFYVAHLPSRAGSKKGSSQLRERGAEIMYEHAMNLQVQYPGIKIVCMGDMNDNPTDPSMLEFMHGKEKREDVTPTDFFSPYISMLKAGYGSLAYQGVWSIYDLELVNYNLTHAPEGTLKLKQTIKGKKSRTSKKEKKSRRSKKGDTGYYGVVYHKPWMETPSGQYKGYPFRTFSGGAFIGGFSDHYPTFIVIGR